VDLNTKFFHTSTLIRRNWNTISLLQSPNSGWLLDRQDIGDCFVNNFKDLYASTCPSPHKDLLALFDSAISVEDNVMLCATPTEPEIFASLNSLGLSKAPGPDGFIALFYVKYWVHIRVIVLQAVGHFFEHSQLLREQNHTFIALIPKKLGASSVHHYRPISLCNIIYKIISKLLANWLKPCWIRLSLLSRLLLFQAVSFRTTQFWLMKCYTRLSLNVVVGALWRST